MMVATDSGDDQVRLWAREFRRVGQRGGVDPEQFVLAAVGTYQVNFLVSVDEPGQLVLALNGIRDGTRVVQN